MLPSLDQALEDGESQHVEYKESISLWEEVAQGLVAFANAQGGQVFFGVTDQRRPKGVEVGHDTIEKLTGKLEARIYPSLPLEVELFPGENDRKVIRVAVPHDVPPVIGAYLYSPDNLDPAKPFNVARVQAYRRVGRRTQKIDFMWLRGRLASDPVVLIDGRDSERRHDVPSVLRCWVWLAVGTGPAYAINVSTDPPITSSWEAARDLPAYTGAQGTDTNLRLSLADTDIREFSLLASYRDDWGCIWESRRRMEVSYGAQAGVWPTSELSRRITTLPAKCRIMPQVRRSVHEASTRWPCAV